MDSMLRRIMAVLLLAILLPGPSCAEEDELVICSSTMGYGWGRCETSEGLNLTKSDEFNYTVIVLHEPPVHIALRFSSYQNPAMKLLPLDEKLSCSVQGDTVTFKKEKDYWKGDITVNGSSSLQPKNGSYCMPFSMDFEFTDKTIMKDSSKQNNAVVLGLSIAAGIAVIVIVAVVVVLRRRSLWHKLSPMNSRNSKDSDFASVNDLSDLEIGAPRLYSYKDLSSATHSFSSKYVVGEGGFGTVYKGVLKDSGSPVAIKRLSQYARQGAREFMAEVKIISQLRHRNLVQLLGWCLEKDELILVYEYMPNGDLDDLIYADKPKCDLSWKQRYNILCGVATALVYLHEEWIQRVVHRDVKTSNVMLDSNLNARLGDFGLARLSAHSQAPHSTLVAGTLGYLAPEFSMSGKATDKTDVYAFGVVALEVTCARRPLSPDLVLVDWAWDHHKQDRLLDAVDSRLDPKLRSSDDEVQMKIVIQVALLCCHPDPNARPSMRQVLNMLKGEASIPRVPRSKPVASYFEDD